MTSQTIITRINHQDPRCISATEAEERLFARFDLDYRVHTINLTDPDLRLRVLEVGEGPPLLMVPGGTGDAVFLAPLMAELKGWRIIALNRPGGGMSDGIDHRQVDLQRLAVKTLETVADAFDVERVPVISNSMGGLWSFWYALANPDRVSRMVQMGCPALILDSSAPFFMRLLSVPGINSLIANAMQPQSIDKALEGLRMQGSSQEDIDRIPREGAEAAYHFFHLPTYKDAWKTLISGIATLGGARPQYQLRANALRQVKCPVQFVWGDKDPFGGLDVARKAVEIIPDARLHAMQAGHLPFLDKPEETGRVVREFLTEDLEATAPKRSPAHSLHLQDALS